MRARWVISGLLLLGLCLSSTSAAADDAAGAPRMFVETGHTVAYAFRVFWEANGGLPMLGYPLTEVFWEAGRPVQYFERARLEWHGDQALVLAGHLGRWAAQRSADHPAFAPVAGSATEGSEYFAETGHTLGGAFQQFWHANGGLVVFGYPVSEEFGEHNREDGRDYVVQYFERARFEWRPDLPPQQQVQLGHLGRQYLQTESPAPEWALEPIRGPESAWDGVRPTHIRMPRIELDTEIVEGGVSLLGWEVPRYTAVHYWPIAGVPWGQGNIVIAGHVGYRDTIFSQLPAAVPGDEVVVSVGAAERRYRVVEMLTVLPHDSWVMAPTREELLTLITCVPPGVYSHRLIVRAAPVAP